MVPEAGKRYSSIFACLLHPASHGSVHISSKEPLKSPLIDPGYFTNPMDIELMKSGVEFIKRMAETEPMRSTFVTLMWPNDLDAEDPLGDYCKRTCITTAHPAGTAAMLPREQNGVVGPRLLVYGTENLRIVSCPFRTLL